MSDPSSASAFAPRKSLALRQSVAGSLNRRLGVWVCSFLLSVAGAASAQTADFGDHSVFASASSTVVSTIKIGATTDTESSATTNATATGDDITGSDDEEGVTLPASVGIGQAGTMTVNVTNTSGATVYLNAWIDYNRNGNADTGEQVATNITIANGTSNANRPVNFTVPTTATVGTSGVRVRLTSVSSPSISGAKGNGECEDYTISVVCPAISLSPESVAAATVGTAYSQTITASGGVASYTYAVAGGTLPAGLTLGSTTGTISGTPTATNGAGTTVTIRATDSKGCQGSLAYVLQVCPAISLSPASLALGAAGSPYSQTVTATGGVGPYNYDISSGALPAGLNLDAATGVISGTPSAGNGAGASITIRAMDANGCQATRSYTLQVCPVVSLSPGSLPGGVVGTAYSQAITASGGTAPYTYAIVSGTLPSGLTLGSGTGILSGTPSAANGTGVAIIVRATDANGCQATESYSLQVCPVVSLSPATLPGPTVGAAYSQTVTATGGVSPYTFSLASGSLPSGLSLNSSTGIVSGTPNAANGTGATVVVRATDANGCAATQSYLLQVCPAISISPASLANGAVGTVYSQTVSATGGATPYTYAVVSGGLPAGLTLSSGTGIISGTPTSGNGAGSAVTIRATDANGCQATQSYTLQVCPAVSLSPASLAGATAGAAYSQTITTSGGASPYTYALVSGTLPSGLTLGSSTGTISGTPSSANGLGASITVRATDANGCQGTQSYVLQVCPTVSLTPTSLPGPVVGVSYNQSVTATGGASPFTYNVVSGTLPAGLTLNSTTGSLSGTPSAANGAGATITIRAMDANGCQGTQAYLLQVCPVVSLSPASLTGAVAGTAYSQTVAATGGASPYTYAIAGGALPAGLTLGSGTGTISGTPSASNGTGASITIRATDANGCQTTRSFVLQVCPVISMSPANVASFVVDTPYSQTVTATGGSAPYSFGVASGALPTGFTLDPATGVLSGTTSSSDTASFSITATDANGCPVTRSYTMPVCPAIALSPATLPNGTVGAAYSQTIAPSAGTSPFVFSVASGALPAGLSLNTSTGVISGTPTSPVAAAFTISITDGRSCQGAQAYTVTPDPNTDYGDFASFPGASSTVKSVLRIGATVDAEVSATTNATATGDDTTGSDDEDGVTMPATITQGAAGSLIVNLSNSTGTTAFLNIWIDFNRNGILTDAGEQVASNITVANSTNNANRTVNFTVPTDVNPGTAGVRVRLTSVSSPGPDGADGAGEIEDVVTTIAAVRDSGDFAGFAGASSTANSTLRLGALVDADGSAALNSSATGDDTTDSDDEDGATLSAVLTQNTTDSLTVNVTNSSGANAYVNVWIDFNRNGSLLDSGEQVVVNSQIVKNTVDADRTFTFSVPTNASPGTAGVRVRFTSISAPGPDGYDGNGEVEDYVVLLAAPVTDFGDYNGFANASSTVDPNLRLGSVADVEGSPVTTSLATGDDTTDSDDEDAVTFPAMTAGQPVSLPVAVTNVTGAPAYLNAWIDYDNNGVLSNEEQIATDVVIANGILDGSQTIEFTVPPDAVTAATQLGARFRLTSVASPGPTGAAGSGEVEDYATPILAPLTDFGDFSGTPNVSNTASSTLRIGTSVDTEYSATRNATGTGDDITGTDDEDGVTVPALTAGAPATIPVVVTNTTGSPAYLNVWIDYNANGSFTDAGEQISNNLSIATGTNNSTRNLAITVPATATTATSLCARFRITNDITPGSSGAGGLGEVEDYAITIAAPTTDFGDFSLFGSASGTANSNLRLGAALDTEYVATTNTGASGDDNTATDDEDGVDLPAFVAGGPATIPVIVTNTRGSLAYLNMWVDFNGNGVPTDPGEQVATNVEVADGLVNSTINLNITVPASTLTGVNLGVRVRLTSTSSPTPLGLSGFGEVEDYTVNVTAPTTDLGDFSRFADASQGVSPVLRLGANVDAEFSSTRDLTATGDDNTATDDEDAVTLPSMTAGQTVIVPVLVTNNTGAQGYLNAWIDYNNDGTLTANEQIANDMPIATGTNNGTANITVTVPATAATGVSVGARFRLSAPNSPGPTGPNASVGEVEDYVVTIAAPTTDYGDFSLFADASSTRDAALRIGASTDTEYLPTKNSTGTGDDNVGIDDEDGVTISWLGAGLSGTMSVAVTNTRGSTAYLNAWIDYSNNGALTAGEQIASNITIANGTNNATRTINFTVPKSSVTGVPLGVRVRLTSTASPGPTGLAGSGEVEDYVVLVDAPTLDYGDFSGFAEASNGVNTNLRMGDLVDTDAEFFATTDALATGDDVTDSDDEDGVTLPAMTAGGTYSIPIVVTNTTGSMGYLSAWMDFNNNGVLTDPGEQFVNNLAVTNGSQSITFNRSVTVPANAVTGVNVGVRFRISTSSGSGPTGSDGGTGEIEDYVTTIAAPTTDFGDFSSFGNASSTVVSTLKLGTATTDTEFLATTTATASGDDTTATDDEDGVTMPSMTAGAPASMPIVVTNNRGSNAYLNVWIDFNRNGSLTDAGEQVASNVVIATGTTNLTRSVDYTVPANAITATDLGVRVRLTSTTSPGPTGFSGEGEVEDYVTTIAIPLLDYGDWAGVADASSTMVDGLRIGATTDTEYVSTRNGPASGDDNTGSDDEDGVTIPELTAGAPGSITIVVTNTTGSNAFLNAWIDFNNNGVLSDAGEQIATNVSAPKNSNNVTHTLTFTVPAAAATGASIGVRVRLTSTSSPGITGLSGNGEVEDHTTTIAVPVTDFGDWNGAADASSLASSDLRMGALADTEYVSTLNATATGDDMIASDDEDGVTLSTLVPSTTGSASVVVTNNTGAPGYLNAWFDFNANGVFTDAGEQISTNRLIATGTNGVTDSLSFPVPAGAIPGQRGVRFRLTNTQNPSPTGASGIGEVEDYTVTVTCAVIAVSPSSLPNGVVGSAYSQTVTASGSPTAFTYSISSGALPAGLSLNASTGVISGTPTSSASATFTVRAMDANGCPATQSYTTAPLCPTVTVLPASVAVGTTGTAYSQTLTASGGTSPYTFAVTSGTLPAGLSLNASSGVISGTPSAANGTGVSVTIRATDTYGCVGSRIYTIQVCPAITVNPTSLPAATAGTAYSQTISASGGATPYVYSVASGTLPTGLTLNASTGVLSGTVSSSNGAGASITFRATDASGCVATRILTVKVCPVITISPTTAPTAYYSSSYNATLAASGGASPYTWSITSGTLPSGLSMSTAGIISGTPTVLTTTSVTVSAVDANGCPGTASVSITVKGLALGNAVWQDNNHNGVKNAGEPGVTGAVVQLFNPGTDNAIGGTGGAADVQVGSNITTGSSGAYSFSGLAPGSYFVKVTPPAGFSYSSGTPATTDNNVDGNNDGSQPGGADTPLYSPVIALSIGGESTTDGDTDADTNLTVDFGLWSPLSVGNYVFQDINRDGNLDLNEGVAYTLVYVYQQGATPGVSTPAGLGFTDYNGRYLVTGLDSGNYFIHIPASQFGAGMPLQGLVPLATVVAGDDNSGQDLIFNNNPAVNGASTAVFALNFGEAPTGSAESGFEGTFDDDTDAAVDLTRDLGLVTDGGTGFPLALRYRRTIEADAETLDVVGAAPVTFAQWQQTAGGSAAPDANPDADQLANLLEYALGTDPFSGLSGIDAFRLELNPANGAVDAVFSRPGDGRADIVYAIEGSVDLHNWVRLPLPPSVSYAADGTQTRRVAGVDAAAVFAGSVRGFVRLTASLDSDLNGVVEAVAATPAYGFSLESFAVGTRSLSMPLLQPEIFAGEVTAVSSNVLAIANAEGLAAKVETGTPYYAEILDGAYAGHRCDIASLADGTVTIATTSARNTLVALPVDLAGARIAIRPHWTLAKLLPVDLFTAGTNADDADRVMFFDRATNTFKVHYLSGNGWQTVDGDAAEGADRIIASAEGALVHVRHTATAARLIGQVSANPLVASLSAGAHFLGSASALPWALPLRDDFVAGAAPEQVTRVRIWTADDQPEGSGYTSYFLGTSAAGARWLLEGEPLLEVPATELPLQPFRAFFFSTPKAVSGWQW